MFTICIYFVHIYYYIIASLYLYATRESEGPICGSLGPSFVPRLKSLLCSNEEVSCKGSCGKVSGSNPRRSGRTSVRKHPNPSSAFSTGVLDKMYAKTELKHRQWEKLHALIADSTQASELSREIAAFYRRIDQKAEEKRKELQQAQGRTAHLASTGSHADPDLSLNVCFKDLQGNLALTARKIYESVDSPDDDEKKCSEAAEFLDKLLVEFDSMDHTVLVFVRRCLLRLEFASHKLGSDREAVLAAVRQNGPVLQLASVNLQSDKQVVMEAVRQDGSGLALEFACKEFQRDKEIVMAAVKQNGKALRFASEDLQSDEETKSAAVQAQDRLVQQSDSRKPFSDCKNRVPAGISESMRETDMNTAVHDCATLKAFVDANQTDLCSSSSLIGLYDKFQKLQKVHARNFGGSTGLRFLFGWPQFEKRT